LKDLKEKKDINKLCLSPIIKKRKKTDLFKIHEGIATPLKEYIKISPRVKKEDNDSIESPIDRKGTNETSMSGKAFKYHSNNSNQSNKDRINLSNRNSPRNYSSNNSTIVSLKKPLQTLTPTPLPPVKKLVIQVRDIEEKEIDKYDSKISDKNTVEIEKFELKTNFDNNTKKSTERGVLAKINMKFNGSIRKESEIKDKVSFSQKISYLSNETARNSKKNITFNPESLCKGKKSVSICIKKGVLNQNLNNNNIIQGILSHKNTASQLSNMSNEALSPKLVSAYNVQFPKKHSSVRKVTKNV